MVGMNFLCVCVQRGGTGSGAVLYHPGVQGTKDYGMDHHVNWEVKTLFRVTSMY